MNAVASLFCSYMCTAIHSVTQVIQEDIWQ